MASVFLQCFLRSILSGIPLLKKILKKEVSKAEPAPLPDKPQLPGLLKAFSDRSCQGAQSKGRKDTMCRGGRPSRKGWVAGDRSRGRGPLAWLQPHGELHQLPAAKSPVPRFGPELWLSCSWPDLASLCRPPQATFHQRPPTRGSGRAGSRGTHLPTSLSGWHPGTPHSPCLFVGGDAERR